MKLKLPHLSKFNFLGISVTLISLSALLFYNISPLTLHQYTMVCGDSGTMADHSRCMHPYWTQYSLDTVLIKAMAGLLILNVVYYLLNKSKK